VISASYIRIAIYVSGFNCNSRQLGINVQNKKRAKDEKAIKRTTIIILVAFLLCMLPNQVAYFLLDFGSVDQKRAAIALVDTPAYLDIPTYFHSCVNPIIYGAVFRQFREGYAPYVSCILNCLCGIGCGKKSNHSTEKALVEGLATRRRRGFERVKLNDQVLMESNFVDLRQNEHGRGLTGDVSFGNVVLESNA